MQEIKRKFKTTALALVLTYAGFPGFIMSTSCEYQHPRRSDASIEDQGSQSSIEMPEDMDLDAVEDMRAAASAAPFYKITLMTAPTINEDAVYASNLTFTPNPATNLSTGKRRGSFILMQRPRLGVVVFNSNGATVKADVSYKAFQNLNGYDKFSFYYREPATATTPERRSNVLTVNVNIKPVNDPPFIIGPKKIAARRMADPTTASETRTFAYSIYDIDSPTLSISHKSPPPGTYFDNDTRVLSIYTESLKGGGTITLSATDGKATTNQAVAVGVKYEYAPITVFYNGSTKPFLGSQPWDQNGSQVTEVTRAFAEVPLYNQDKLLRFTLKNRGYWGAAVHPLNSQGLPVDLTKYRYLSFAIGWDRTEPHPDARVFLVNSENGTESLAEVFPWPDGGLYPRMIDLNYIASNGFDLRKVTGVAVAVSRAEDKDFVIYMDDITFIGITPVPLDYPVSEVQVSFTSNYRLKMDFINPPAGTVTKYTWKLNRWDKPAMTTVESTTPYLNLASYSNFIGGSVSGSITIGTKTYQASNSIEIPLNTAASGNAGFNNMAYDIVAPSTDANAEVNYMQDLQQARLALMKAEQNASENNPMALVPVTDGFLWTRGIIRYTFKDLSATEQSNVVAAMREIYERTGIIFVANTSFMPQDFPKTDIPLLTIRLMNKDDMVGKDDQTKINKLNDARCFVRGLGRRAFLVALKNATTGDSQCLEYSATVGANPYLAAPGQDPTISDRYVADTLLHELLHAAGMAHEQLSPDSYVLDSNNNFTFDSNRNVVFRKDYVNTDVIVDWQLGQFQRDAQVSYSRRTYTYDPNSIMMYSRFSDSICRKTGDQPAGTPVWDYTLLDPDDPMGYNKKLTAKLDNLAAKELAAGVVDGSGNPYSCARNATWFDFVAFPVCADDCATLPKAPVSPTIDPPAGAAASSGLSPLDVDGLQKLYRLNWLVRNVANIPYESDDPAMTPANVVGSLDKLTREIMDDIKAKAATPGSPLIMDDPAKPHFFVAQLLSSFDKRAIGGICRSPETNIIDGRRACKIPPHCIQPEVKGNKLVLASTDFKITTRGETNCAVRFPDDGSICVEGTARGYAANGSYGLVWCRIEAYELNNVR